MRIFLTGATGFIGSALLPELLEAGHQVLGLTRSDAGAEALRVAGAEVQRGSLEDLDSLRRGAAGSDAVIHCAFDHDFSNYAANCEKDRQAIHALGGVLAGSDRKLLITSGTAMGSPGPGQPAIEDFADLNHPLPRVATEVAGAEVAAQGVQVIVMRLSQIHDTVKQGLVTYVIERAREMGVSAYPGDGANRWAASHVRDTVHLYRLALEHGQPGARYHAVTEEGVSSRAIAEAIGKGLGVPVRSVSEAEAPAHFGWLAGFAGMEITASSELTRQRLGWKPTGPGLIADLEQKRYA